MGRIALDSLAARIGEELKSSEYYREEVLNKQQHKYTLTGEGLYKTVSEQLKNIKKYRERKISSSEFDTILKNICNTAAPEILKALKNYKGNKVDVKVLSPTSVLVIPSNPGEDVFEFIKATRRRRLNKYLKDPIIEQLFGSFNKTSAYKKYMSQPDEDYEAQVTNPTQRGAKRINALNQAIFGSRQELTDKETGEKKFKRNSETNQIIVQGGFTDIGHRKEDAVSLRRQADALENILNDTLFIESIFGGVGGLSVQVTKEVIGRKLSSLKAGFSDVIKQGFTVIIVESTEEGSSANRREGATVEKSRLASLKPTLMRSLEKEPWATQEGSDSPLSAIQKVIVNTTIDSLTKNKRAKVKKGRRQKIDENKNSGKSILKSPKPTKAVRSSNGAVLAAPSTTTSRRAVPKPAQQTWSSLLPILNAKLTPRVIANMRFPSLVNRTGTFANSAKVINIEQTREGFPTFVFDYERDPYNVFDKTQGRAPWNTPERDPRALVDKSVREIVREMAVGRFYTRRA